MFGYFSHHKCGTIWVASIIEKVCAAAGLVAARHDSGGNFDGDIVAWRQSHPFDFWCYTNADFTFVRGVAVEGFHVVRDPRDIVVSAYFSHLYSHPVEGWPRLRHYRHFLRSLPEEEGILREMEFSAPVMADMLVWDEHPPAIRLVRFEDLIARPAGFFCEIFEGLGLLPDRIDEWTVREIVERHSFERLSGGRHKGQGKSAAPFPQRRPGRLAQSFHPAPYGLLSAALQSVAAEAGV